MPIISLFKRFSIKKTSENKRIGLMLYDSAQYVLESYFHAAVIRWLFVWARPHWQVSVKEHVAILCNIYYRHTSQAYWNKMSWQQRAEQNKTLISRSISFLFAWDGGVIMSHPWRETSQVETRQWRVLANVSSTTSLLYEGWWWPGTVIEGLWTALLHKTAPCQMRLVCNPATQHWRHHDLPPSH